LAYQDEVNGDLSTQAEKTLDLLFTKYLKAAISYEDIVRVGRSNAFFRAGEIEAWGRGIERIFTACREAGTPVPNLRFESSGLWAA
jgi:predicted HTH transcriptional regulator